MKRGVSYLIHLFVIGGVISSCTDKKTSTSENHVFGISDTIEVSSDQSLGCRELIDSVWFEDYVKERQVNPYADTINPENAHFEDYQSYYDTKYSDVRITSDTVINQFNIRTYMLRDSLELAYTHKVGDRFYGSPYCFNIFKGAIVIEDIKECRRDSIIIYRKLIEDFLNEDLSWTELTFLAFNEIRNDSIIFSAGYFAPDSDWGADMEIKFHNRKLFLEEIIVPFGE